MLHAYFRLPYLMPWPLRAPLWLKHTHSISVRQPSRLHSFFSAIRMMQHRTFGLQEEEADAQMHETFQALAPYLRPILDQPPGAKRLKGRGPPMDAADNGDALRP